MDGVRVVGVEFDFLGHVLFFDKDAAAERPGLLHARAIVADLDDTERSLSLHRIPLARVRRIVKPRRARLS
jgi:sorbitol-specific phosphotransferase system component IIA